MKYLITLILLLGVMITSAQQVSLRSTLLKQLKSTHNEKDWFVPVNVALEGLTPEQAAWKDNSGNHSVGQLANHLLFWNERQLNNFLGKKNSDFGGNNDETFNAFDEKSWAETTRKLDAVMVGIEKVVQDAEEAKLKEWAPTIANISTHNAYHTGQIIVVRKLQGSWDAAKGVK